MFKILSVGASALALAATPIAASAAPLAAGAAATSHVVRASTPTSDESNLAGRTRDGTFIPYVILLGIVGAVAYLVVDHENDRHDRPNSP